MQRRSTAFRILATGCVLAALAGGCSRCASKPAEPSWPIGTHWVLGQEPEALGPTVVKAETAFERLSNNLSGRLIEALAEGDPAAAVPVCGEAAGEITGEVASGQGFAMGRTSHKLRNPANAPREWARPFVLAGAGRKVAEVTGHVVDLGERVGVLVPIVTGGLCLHCHQPEQGIRPEIRQALAKRYPEDQATGFAPGDLRGWFWAEVPTPEPARAPAR